MVSTDGRTDTEGYNIIPRHTLVAGYKNGYTQLEIIALLNTGIGTCIDGVKIPKEKLQRAYISGMFNIAQDLLQQG